MITGDIERVREALRFIPADDRETWIKVGMAVKSGWGDAGFDAWDAWSQQADSYSARDARDVWKSISGNGKVTAGTLFHEAKARGWSGVPTSEEHANVAQKAAAIWKASTPAPDDHPYLVRKGIKAHGLRLYKGALVAPMRADAELHSLQFIRADGTKRFLKGGRVAGCYCNIGDANGAAALCIGEGFATAASIYEATGLPVAVSFNAGNLEPVAKSLRAKFPNVSVIVCADDDIRTEGNPGITKATTAARSVGGKVAIPDFGVDRPDGATDFNDLAEHRGLQAVERAIANASAPARGEVQASGESAPVADPANANAWPDPLPLPSLPSVTAFPLAILPDAFGPWVSDAAERARFAPDFAAVAAMVAIGSLIGRKIGIRLKARDDWTEYANVWGTLVGLPSALKSPAMRDAMAPFKRLQVEADGEYRGAALRHEAEREIVKLRNDGFREVAKKALKANPNADVSLQSVESPGALAKRVYWTSDATAEKLGEILSENPTGLLVERDELSGLLTSLEDERNAAARGFYLSGWSGKEGYRFDRIMRGTTAISAFALSVIGGIQPGPLERYVRGAQSGAQADGLLQRFQLIVWPDTPAFEYIDRWPDKEVKEAANDVFRHADTFDPVSIGHADNFGTAPPFLRLDTNAQGLFVEWYEGFMRKRRERDMSGEDASAISSHFGKYPGLLGKLALILHIADDPNGRAVSEQTMMKALGWLEYLESHARRVYHALDTPDADTARLLLARIRRNQVSNPFKPRDVYRNGWHGLGDAPRVKAACRLLADYEHLREHRSDEGIPGRPADPVYFINPKAAL